MNLAEKGNLVVHGVRRGYIALVDGELWLDTISDHPDDLRGHASRRGYVMRVVEGNEVHVFDTVIRKGETKRARALLERYLSEQERLSPPSAEDLAQRAAFCALYSPKVVAVA